MKYVAFKTYGMLGNKKYPDAYPALCHEFECAEGEDFPQPYQRPEYVIMSEGDFFTYQITMSQLYSDAVNKANLTKRPWYKFFSK